MLAMVEMVWDWEGCGWWRELWELAYGSFEAVEFHAPDLADGRHGGGGGDVACE